jgi:hypothetical protein
MNVIGACKKEFMSVMNVHTVDTSVSVVIHHPYRPLLSRCHPGSRTSCRYSHIAHGSSHPGSVEPPLWGALA